MSQDNAPYDGYAAVFLEEAAVSAYNAYYDRPAVLDLLGDVRGRHVLDAGCGPGLYAGELVDRGAEVTAFDQSEDMVGVARQHLGPGLTIRQHDLEKPLDWLPDESFDLVVMALVIHYVRDRIGALRELGRVLRPEGRLVISTSHPTADWIFDGGGYFDEKYVEDKWSCGLLNRFWRQPIASWLFEFAVAGFLVERLIEPRPVPEMADRHPGEYAKLMREPGFVAFRLVKANVSPIRSDEAAALRAIH